MKRAIVIYDGDCGICEKFKKIVMRLDWFHRFEFEPFQQDQIFLTYPWLSREECEKELKLIEDEKNVFGGADAVLKICFKVPLLMIVGRLFWIPPLRQFARWAYVKVANNRHRISKC